MIKLDLVLEPGMLYHNPLIHEPLPSEILSDTPELGHTFFLYSHYYSVYLNNAFIQVYAILRDIVGCISCLGVQSVSCVVSGVLYNALFALLIDLYWLFLM